jgi:hypothetical protein
LTENSINSVRVQGCRNDSVFQLAKKEAEPLLFPWSSLTPYRNPSMRLMAVILREIPKIRRTL